jgi:SAM-dependent methyltransferase
MLETIRGRAKQFAPVRFLRRGLSRLPFLRSRKTPRSFQARRQNSREKVALLNPVLRELECRSVLDVGCNAGAVSRLLGEHYFVVGIDQRLNVSGFEHPFKSACLGEVQLSLENVRKMPMFDAVVLLSVHHQWHHHRGDTFAAEMVQAVAGRASKVFFIEFAALNRKYQEEGPSRFQDNDEASVTAYARDWLRAVLPDHQVRYLGKAVESPHEPYRFMFACLSSEGSGRT